MCNLCKGTGWISIGNGHQVPCPCQLQQPHTSNNCTGCWIITDSTGQIKKCSGQCSK